MAAEKEAAAPDAGDEADDLEEEAAAAEADAPATAD